ncbi:uncharacterized protein LOC117174624 [Belonocnema kinseyi]|uniref:uncharacterized protein LOC117174624 n=1 Tax=Belonocnema kinseyi TaxID=2817044 RepID=UPI00143CC787|nr:uncharacterized protein LOC117174624 [Belonocnema kinseyi]
MSKQPVSRLLIVCGILSQGIVALSVENFASSDLLTRQKRSTRLAHSELFTSHQHHQPVVQPIIRVPLQQFLETPSAVSIRINGVRVGLGIVVHANIIATKASYVHNTPLSRASVTYYSPTRQDYERREVRHIEICLGIPNLPLAPHNVALVVVNRSIPVDGRNSVIETRLRENFTPGEVLWIRDALRTLIPRLRRRNNK